MLQLVVMWIQVVDSHKLAQVRPLEEHETARMRLFVIFDKNFVIVQTISQEVPLVSSWQARHISTDSLHHARCVLKATLFGTARRVIP